MKKAFNQLNEQLAAQGKGKMIQTTEEVAKTAAKKKEDEDLVKANKEAQATALQDEELEQARRNARSETMRKEGAPTSNRRFLKGAK